MLPQLAHAGARILDVPKDDRIRRRLLLTLTDGASPTDTLIAKLAALRDQGSISDEEFQHAKAKLLGRQPERPVTSTT